MVNFHADYLWEWKFVQEMNMWIFAMRNVILLYRSSQFKEFWKLINLSTHEESFSLNSFELLKSYRRLTYENPRSKVNQFTFVVKWHLIEFQQNLSIKIVRGISGWKFFCSIVKKIEFFDWFSRWWLGEWEFIRISLHDCCVVNILYPSNCLTYCSLMNRLGINLMFIFIINILCKTREFSHFIRLATQFVVVRYIFW